MNDDYTVTLVATGHGIGEVTITVQRVLGTNCPEIYAVYKNRTPFIPLGCTTFRLDEDPDVEYLFQSDYEKQYPYCEFVLTATAAP